VDCNFSKAVQIHSSTLIANFLPEFTSTNWIVIELRFKNLISFFDSNLTLFSLNASQKVAKFFDKIL